MTDDAPAAGGVGRAGVANGAQDLRTAREQTGNQAAMEDRIARGAGVQDQIDRGADIREQNRLTAPEPDAAGGDTGIVVIRVRRSLAG
jgi:hypothetical protein